MGPSRDTLSATQIGKLAKDDLYRSLAPFHYGASMLFRTILKNHAIELNRSFKACVDDKVQP